MIKIEIDFGDDQYKIETEIKKDGDMWCVGSGEDLQVGIHGFGSKIHEAIAHFKENFRNS